GLNHGGVSRLPGAVGEPVGQNAGHAGLQGVFVQGSVLVGILFFGGVSGFLGLSLTGSLLGFGLTGSLLRFGFTGGLFRFSLAGSLLVFGFAGGLFPVVDVHQGVSGLPELLSVALAVIQ